MKMNEDALEVLKLKLAKYSEENATIGEHDSLNMNGCQCTGHCGSECTGTCHHTCAGSCSGGSSGRW